jgi:hypothetical protein
VPKRDEVTGERRRLHNKALYSVLLSKYHSGDQVKKTEMGRRGAYRALVGKPEGRRPLERLTRRWKNNIKMDFRDVGWGHGLDQSGSG